MVVKLGQNLPEMIMCVADVAREKQHGRCSNNAKQSNHSIKTFSQVFFFLFLFLFSKSRDKLSYHICHSPLFVVVDQLTLLPTSYCPLHWCIWMGHNTISVLAWLAWMHSPNLQSPISMHAKYKPQDFTDVIIIWKLHCIAWKIGPNKVIDW